MNVRNMVSGALCGVGVPAIARAAQRASHGPYIRAVNAHATPPRLRDAMRRQLETLRRWFEPASLQDVRDLLTTGSWRGATRGKPGLLFCFDDGVRTNFEVAAPVLEEFGFSGLFFVPVGFLDCPVPEQATWAKEHSVSAVPADDGLPDGRLAMTWDEARSLLGKHEIGAHTRNHCRMWPTVSPERMRDEIVTAKSDLESRIGRLVDTFCWVGGEVEAHASPAPALVREAGFKYAFSTASFPITRGSSPLALQRTQLEPYFPLARVNLACSGLIDAYFTGRRRKIVAAMQA